MTERSATTDRISVRLAHSLDDMGRILAVADEVWGSPAGAMVSPDFLMALAHTGGYVALAELSAETPPTGTLSPTPSAIGASFGFLARHNGDLGLHSHITGVIARYQHLGIGYLIKQHQRSWALDHDLEVITWTFDPLVRRNGWFNLHRLGATAEEYHVNFYGPLGDAINGADETDRLMARWDLLSPQTLAAQVETLPPVQPGPRDHLVATPSDIVAIRQDDPARARQWRVQLRQALSETLTTHRIAGISADGSYVLSPRQPHESMN